MQRSGAPNRRPPRTTARARSARQKNRPLVAAWPATGRSGLTQWSQRPDAYHDLLNRGWKTPKIERETTGDLDHPLSISLAEVCTAGQRCPRLQAVLKQYPEGRHTATVGGGMGAKDMVGKREELGEKTENHKPREPPPLSACVRGWQSGP